MTTAVAVLQSQSQVALANRSAVLTVGATPPREIQDGILALPVAFQAGRNLDKSDRDLQAILYLEALSGYEVFVADLVLHRIRLFNPRNPFPPTAQDLREHCASTQATLRAAVWLSVIDGKAWEPRSSRLPREWFSGVGPKPFSAGCIVPDTVAAQWIRERLDTMLDASDLERFCQLALSDYRRAYIPWALAVSSRCAALSSLPDNAWPDGLRAAYQRAAVHLDKMNHQRNLDIQAEQKRRLEKYGVEIAIQANVP